MSNPGTLYINGKESVINNNHNLFIYEVEVFCIYKNYYSLINSQFYSSKIFIPNIVERFFVNPYCRIHASLYSAPTTWLAEHNFVIYEKPKKLKNVKPKISTN